MLFLYSHPPPHPPSKILSMNIGNLPAYLPLFISPSPRLSLSLPPLSPSLFLSLSLSLPLSFSLPLSLVRFRLVLGSWRPLLLSSRLEGLGFRFFCWFEACCSHARAGSRLRCPRLRGWLCHAFTSVACLLLYHFLEGLGFRSSQLK